jgi:hypothetical protein
MVTVRQCEILKNFEELQIYLTAALYNMACGSKSKLTFLIL